MPRDGNHEFRKLGRLRSCRDMETQVPLTRGAVFVWAGDGNREVPRTRRFPSCHETEAPKFRRLGRFSVVPRHGNPSSPHRGHGFCRGGTWKSPSFPELGGVRRAAKNGNPGGFRRAVTWKLEVPHTWATVSVTLRHGTPKYPVLGVRFPSRRDMGTPGFPDLGKFSAVPRNGNPEFLQIGAVVRRVAKWKRVCMRRDMGKKTRSSQRLGSAVSKHHQFPRLGQRFPSSWKPQVSSAA